MKQIIKFFETEPIKVVDISTLTSDDYYNKIVAYETKPHTKCQDSGLGLLIQCTDHRYGFVYHKTLIKGKTTSATYKADSATGAVCLALNAGRKVFIFDSFEEFVHHASEYASRY